MTDYKDRVSGWATDIDWSKAPEGAKHWGPENSAYVESWYKKCDGKWMYATYSSRWQWGYLVFGIKHEREIELIPRPTPQWPGDGLPPVGTFVRITDDGSLHYGSSESGEVIAHVEDCAVVRMSYGLGCFTARYLEAIKTPAQIAAEEREAAVLGMLCHDALGASRRGLAEALYDAGYRKIKGEDQLPHHQLLVSQMN